MSSQEIYRDSVRASHRQLGLYLAIVAWKKGLDCVAIQRHALMKYLRIEVMRNARKGWLITDLSDMFPYIQMTVSTRSQSHHSIYLSRREFPKEYTWQNDHTNNRVRVFTSLGLRSAIIAIPDHRLVLKTLMDTTLGISTLPTGE